MTGIPEQEIARYRCILMYDDETVMDAATALRDARGDDWWHVVADLQSGGYAVARFSDLAAQLTKVDETKRAMLLSCSLGELVGTVLTRVNMVVEQEQESLDTLKDRACRTSSDVAVIVQDGGFKGIIVLGGTRLGAMDVGLVSLAGTYATLPEKGLMGRRRRQAMEAKNRKS